MTERASRPSTLVGFAQRVGWRPVALGVFTSVVSGAAGVVLALGLKLVVDGASDGDDVMVTWAGTVLGATLAVQAITSTLSHRYLTEVHLTCGGIIVRDVMRASAVPPGIEHFERAEFADRINLLRREMNYLTSFVSLVGEATGLVGRVLITAVLLAGVHPVLLLLPVLALPSIWGGVRAEDLVNRANVAIAPDARREEHLFSLSTNASSGKELRIFGLADEIVCRQREAWHRVTDVVARAQLTAGLVRTAGWLPFAAGYLAAVALVLTRAGRGDATPGDALMVMLLASQVNGQVAQLLLLANRAAAGVRVLRRYQWLMDYADASLAAAVPAEGFMRVPARLKRGIDLEGVGFAYPCGGVVLDDVNLHLTPGSTVAIVGENGAGKTTLVKLLCRFYEPTAGRITADGVELARFDVDMWRRRVSGGFQDFVRFELLLRQSVGVGDVERIDDELSVSAALGQLGADLPVGLNARLGRQWPGGVDLSEGQWQRVAMARALMRQCPLLVVLDEPTSGLDPHAEQALFEVFADVAATIALENGAIALFVSHRFSTVRMADHIIVLDGGRVVEQGSHDSLMTTGGLYAELYGIQARAYR